MPDQIPAISVVIPTRNRAPLALRAVQSALGQTLAPLEVIVVVDGSDKETEAALAEVRDPKLRVLALAENVGGSEARNVGVRHAEGEWIALLDDDDEWLPAKLEKQIAAYRARIGAADLALVASRFVDRASIGDLIRPRSFPKPSEPISESLFCRVSPFGGIEGFPQTSTWLVSKRLLLDVPFKKGLKCLQDLDWLIRAIPTPGVRMAFVDEPLTIFHNEQSRDRVTKKVDGAQSFAWACENRTYFTRKAFVFFTLIFCVNPLAASGARWNVLAPMIKAALPDLLWMPKAIALLVLYTLVYPAIYPWVSYERRRQLLYRFTNLFNIKRWKFLTTK